MERRITAPFRVPADLWREVQDEARLLAITPSTAATLALGEWVRRQARERRGDTMGEREINVTTWPDAWRAYLEMCGAGDPSITSEQLHAERTADPHAPAYGEDGWHAWISAAWYRHEEDATA